MKYKVILIGNTTGGGNPDLGVGFSFYTYNTALSFAQAWANESGNNNAYFWDGSIMRYY